MGSEASKPAWYARAREIRSLPVGTKRRGWFGATYVKRSSEYANDWQHSIWAHEYVASEGLAKWESEGNCLECARPTIAPDEDTLPCACRELPEQEWEPPHPGCDSCGRPIARWTAPHAQWNKVMGGPEATDDPGGLLCASCYLDRAVQVWPEAFPHVVIAEEMVQL